MLAMAFDIAYGPDDEGRMPPTEATHYASGTVWARLMRDCYRAVVAHCGGDDSIEWLSNRHDEFNLGQGGPAVC
jgi:hypothetical protein